MRYAFIVSACKKYVPELAALLNSLEAIGNKHDVFVIGYELPPELTSGFGLLSYKVNFYDIPEAEARQFGGESEILCRKRFWYAAEWGKDYDAVCVLDADMWFVRPVDQFFEIAAMTGMLLGATLEQKRIYGEIEHHKVLGKQLLDKPTWNHKDICCAPMFFDTAKWGDLMKRSWTIFSEGFPDTNFKAPDMESYNLLILAAGLSDRVLLLCNYSFVATNEKLLKPYTRVTQQTDGKLWTESGEPIYIVHGQFYKARWRNNQILNRRGCASGYLGNPSDPGIVAVKAVDLAKGSMNCLHEWFKRYLAGPITIDGSKAYTINGHPVEFEGEEERV